MCCTSSGSATSGRGSRPSGDVLRRVPGYSSSAGRVMAAFDDEIARATAAVERRRHTPFTVTDGVRLQRTLVGGRAAGLGGDPGRVPARVLLDRGAGARPAGRRAGPRPGGGCRLRGGAHRTGAWGRARSSSRPASAGPPAGSARPSPRRPHPGSTCEHRTEDAGGNRRARQHRDRPAGQAAPQRRHRGRLHGRRRRVRGAGSRAGSRASDVERRGRSTGCSRQDPLPAIVFDATSAKAHIRHAPRSWPRPASSPIDLTPAAVGPLVCPPVNFRDARRCAEHQHDQLRRAGDGADRARGVLGRTRRLRRDRRVGRLQVGRARDAREHRRVHAHHQPRGTRARRHAQGQGDHRAEPGRAADDDARHRVLRHPAGRRP